MHLASQHNCNKLQKKTDHEISCKTESGKKFATNVSSEHNGLSYVQLFNLSFVEDFVYYESVFFFGSLFVSSFICLWYCIFLFWYIVRKEEELYYYTYVWFYVFGIAIMEHNKRFATICNYC